MTTKDDAVALMRCLNIKHKVVEEINKSLSQWAALGHGDGQFDPFLFIAKAMGVENYYGREFREARQETWKAIKEDVVKSFVNRGFEVEIIDIGPAPQKHDVIIITWNREMEITCLI